MGHQPHEKDPKHSPAGALDLAALRLELSGRSGPLYWRGLEELSDTPEFHELVEKEFPASHWTQMDPVSRRGFFRVMAASLALAGLAGCSKPVEEIVPYVRAPEVAPPGVALFFATAMTVAGSAIGLLVESHEGRPTKVEGNPNHPASLGATDVFAQASILSLYDPDRSQALTYLGDIRPWTALMIQVQMLAETQRMRRGAGLRLLTETVVSPVLAQQIQNLLRQFPEARWHQYEPVNADAVRQGAISAFGRYVNPIYRIEKADVIVSLDSDFLVSEPGSVRYAREFARRHSPQRPDFGAAMSRLYVVESTLTNTGAKADHRLPVLPSDVENFARALAAEIRGQQWPSDGVPYAELLKAAARDLKEHRGAGLVVAGRHQPAQVLAWAHVINQTLGNIGSTVVFTEPVEAQPVDQLTSLRELLSDIDAGKVEWLVMLGGNPVYNVPPDLGFGERLQRVPARMHLSQYPDETSALCHWHIPEAHYLEAWSDTRAFDGTVTIVQPLIAPLWGARSAHEFLATFGDQPDRPGYEIVRQYWRQQHSAEFERFWRKSLNGGIVEGTALPAVNVQANDRWVAQQNAVAASAQTDKLEALFRPDPTIFDGRFANNAWLQELPKPITRLTWDNAALVSPATAEKLGFSHKVGFQGGEHGQTYADVGEVTVEGRSVRAPVWIVPGHADNCVTLQLGYGRKYAGHLGTAIGYDAYAVRSSANQWSAPECTLRKTGERMQLACVQFHHSMEGREPVRAASLEKFQSEPDFARAHEKEPAKTFSLYPPYTYTEHAWGMAIDLNACVGCGACVVACQAENNIPVVGKTEVTRGREMHWLRIDHYYKGSLDRPENFFQPIPCMHCENAPCEPVCPVAATVHSSEGLNDMVYNRCIGTRYCSNNCPYKVRRFNFFLYSDWKTPSLMLLRNPDVTVRSRGVMEKCTYCVQRINAGRIRAQQQDRYVRDGEVVTACQQACPADAIVFGNINDPESRVAKLKSTSRNYSLLADLNTQPRTTYLAAVTNPNSEVSKGEEFGH
ncbi:MAG: TAT-variant-translocated molybdopterin oxidoreductase [Acidobacteria bacterium]|nr:TAT-variant-translocated molybdopterin oxidoreductase [Acidobacteriota bacterium]